jgi:glycosyltransferase involved in cell wall biosynthesis
MATYNGERFLDEQINSILNQLSKGDELIISDDGSTDKTIEIIENFSDPRIKLLKADFHSPILNFQNALQHAENDLIFLSDQDDVWLDDKVEKMVQSLEEHDLVVSDCFLVDEEGKIIADSFFDRNHSGPGLIKNIYKNGYLGCCMAFNRKILDHALPFPGDIAMHDIWIGLIGETFGKTLFLPDKLIRYRRHGSNASQAGEQSMFSLSKKILIRLRFIKNLLKRRFIERQK